MQRLIRWATGRITVHASLNGRRRGSTVALVVCVFDLSIDFLCSIFITLVCALRESLQLRGRGKSSLPLVAP